MTQRTETTTTSENAGRGERDLAKKHTFYRTAKARIACALFPAGAIVAVRYAGHCSCHGTVWYDVSTSNEFRDEETTSYPMHHLTDFVL